MLMATEDAVFPYNSVRCNNFFALYCTDSNRKGKISDFYGLSNDRFKIMWVKSEINCSCICVGGGSC